MSPGGRLPLTFRTRFGSGTANTSNDTVFLVFRLIRYDACAVVLMTATSNISSNLQSIKLKYRAGSTFLECLVHLFNWSLRRNVLHRSMLDEKHFSRWKLLCYRLLLSGTKTRKFYVVKFISASHTSFAVLLVSKSIPVRWPYIT